MSRPRIAILTTDDYVWAFPTWLQTIPLLKHRFEVVGVYLFPDRLGRHTGIEVPLWYLRVFGFAAFVLLALYSLKIHLLRIGGRVRTWHGLSAEFGLPLHRAKSPNDAEVSGWLVENGVDVAIIMVSQIVKEPTLSAPRAGMLNKHAAVLPSCKGVFPYFWARARGLPAGMTFHRVDAGIDTGPILVQCLHRSNDAATEPDSMLRFYIDVFSAYPALLIEAVDRLLGKGLRAARPGVEQSYFGLPARNDMKAFLRGGNRIARWSDLVYRSSGSPFKCD